MARKQVSQIACERCTRVEHREIVGEHESSHQPIAFTASVAGKLIASFADLCTPCQRTVNNHLEMIAKKIDGPSPDRTPQPKVVEDLVHPKKN